MKIDSSFEMNLGFFCTYLRFIFETDISIKKLTIQLEFNLSSLVGKITVVCLYVQLALAEKIASWPTH